MARIVCRACGYDGDGRLEDVPTCPRCGSLDCRATVEFSDMPLDAIDRIAASRVSGPAPWLWYHDDTHGRVRMLENGVLERLVVVDGKLVVLERIAGDKRFPGDVVPIHPIRTSTTSVVVEAFVAHGHTPRTVDRDGVLFVLEERWEDGVGLGCVSCGCRHDAVHYTVDAIHACDGPTGLARRLRREARLAKVRWEKADAAARQAEVAADVPRAHAYYLDDRARVEAVMRQFGVADATEARGWPVERILDLAYEVLRTVPEGRVEAVDQAMRVLTAVNSRR